MHIIDELIYLEFFFQHFYMGSMDYLLKGLQIDYSLNTVRLITTEVFLNSCALLTYNNLSVPHTLKQSTIGSF